MHSVTTDQAYQPMREHARDDIAIMRVAAEAIVDVGLQV
jgi:hypothetical protein